MNWIGFNELVNEKRLDDLVARYPVRESRAFDAIAKTLELNSRKTYEQMLVSRIWDDEGFGPEPQTTDRDRSLKCSFLSFTVSEDART